tara:strand:+ start:10139 stop:10387 length:249 start_codon:yes stop_codon:yes gene_type:complete
MKGRFQFDCVSEAYTFYKEKADTEGTDFDSVAFIKSVGMLRYLLEWTDFLCELPSQLLDRIEEELGRTEMSNYGSYRESGEE